MPGKDVKPKRVRQTSSKLSSLAGRVLHGYVPTHEEVLSMAASLLSQDQTPPEIKT